jgi:hypothetical protein
MKGCVHLKEDKNNAKNNPTKSDFIRSTNLNPDDFETPDKDNDSTHLKFPKKNQ